MQFFTECLSCSAVLSSFAPEMQCMHFFPLNITRLNLFKSKPEMAKKHTAFNKYDELGS